MRRRGSPSELQRLLAPLEQLASWLFDLLPAWMGLLVAAWLVSGVTVVRSDEVALVLRFGSLVGAGTAQVVHEPGLLLSPPRPIGEVVRVPVRKVFEVELRTLHYPTEPARTARWDVTGVDPRKVGYAVTGDRNIVHAAMVARYQIADPVAFTFGVEEPERVLGAVVVDEMGRAIGSRGIDAVLTDARAELGEVVRDAAQVRLDALEVGLSLVSVELVDLVPPPQVKKDFADVQSAAINAQTLLQEAREYEAQTLPAAQSERDRAISKARADATSVLSEARGSAEAFRVLALEVARNPGVARERLYREKVEGSLKRAGAMHFIPPPTGGRYSGFRITVK
ncbi:MAG: protease modulator HflK [Myxococcota bacterium]